MGVLFDLETKLNEANNQKESMTIKCPIKITLNQTKGDDVQCNPKEPPTDKDPTYPYWPNPWPPPGVASGKKHAQDQVSNPGNMVAVYLLSFTP